MLPLMLEYEPAWQGNWSSVWVPEKENHALGFYFTFNKRTSISHQTTINQVEAIQKRAGRFVLYIYDWTESVTTILQNLKLSSLQSRREAAMKIMLYKISHSLIAIGRAQYLTPMSDTRLRNYHQQNTSSSKPILLFKRYLQVLLHAHSSQTV